MANAPLLHLPRGWLQDVSPPMAFRLMSLPLEVRNMIYELAIFPNSNPEFFIVNPKIDLPLLQVSRTVSREASEILYTRRIAVIAILPHQYYLHGRLGPVIQLFRSSIEDDTSYEQHPDKELDHPSPGFIHPHILAKFACIRLCLFFPATFQRAYPLMFFDPIAELKNVLEALRVNCQSSSNSTRARNFLEIIVAVYPRPDDEEAETPREVRIREDFVRRGITSELKLVRARRTLKVGGNFTREGLVKFCKITCGD